MSQVFVSWMQDVDGNMDMSVWDNEERAKQHVVDKAVEQNDMVGGDWIKTYEQACRWWNLAFDDVREHCGVERADNFAGVPARA